MWRRRVVVHVVLVPTAISLAILGRSGTDFMESLHVEIKNGDIKSGLPRLGKQTYVSKTGEENKFVLLN